MTTLYMFFFPDIGTAPMADGFDGILPIGFFAMMLNWSDGNGGPPVGIPQSMYPWARRRTRR